MKRERIFYLDFVRAVATISIIFTHYNALFIYNTSIPMPQKAILTMTVGNVYIGSWGVSLFLIISGAALMYVYENELDVLKFWKKPIHTKRMRNDLSKAVRIRILCLSILQQRKNLQ